MISSAEVDTLLMLLDELTKRKIPDVYFKSGDLEIRCQLPTSAVDALPSNVKRALIDSPTTPEDLRKKLVEEEDADLYGAS